MVYLHLCWRSGAMPYVPKLSIRMLQGTNTWIVWNHQFVRNMLMSLAEGVMGDICLRPSIHSCGECACQATDSRSTHQRVGQPKVFLRDTKFSHSNLNIRLMFTYKTWYFNTSHLHLRRSVSSPDFSLEFLDGKKITHPVITLWVEKPEVLGSYAWKRMPDYILNLIPGGFQLSRAYCQWGGDALKKGMVGVVFYLLIVDVCWYLYRLVYILYIYTVFIWIRIDSPNYTPPYFCTSDRIPQPVFAGARRKAPLQRSCECCALVNSWNFKCRGTWACFQKLHLYPQDWEFLKIHLKFTPIIIDSILRYLSISFHFFLPIFSPFGPSNGCKVHFEAIF